MGLIRTKDGRNISVSSVNGYTAEKVLKAEEYIKEVGGNIRTFPLERLVEMYNDIKGTKDKVPSCRCQASKYFMGLQNYVTYGRLTLAANGIDVDAKEEVVEEEVVNEEVNEDVPKKLTPAERMQKAREARKLKKESKDVEDKD